MSSESSPSESKSESWDRIKKKYWGKDWDVDNMLAATEANGSSDAPSGSDE